MRSSCHDLHHNVILKKNLCVLDDFGSDEDNDFGEEEDEDGGSDYGAKRGKKGPKRGKVEKPSKRSVKRKRAAGRNPSGS